MRKGNCENCKHEIYYREKREEWEHNNHAKHTMGWRICNANGYCHHQCSRPQIETEKTAGSDPKYCVKCDHRQYYGEKYFKCKKETRWHCAHCWENELESKSIETTEYYRRH